MLMIDRMKIAKICNANCLIDWEAIKLKKFIEIRGFKKVDGTNDEKDF